MSKQALDNLLTDGVVFKWPIDVMDYLKSKPRELHEEQIHAVSLLLEHGFDLCIAPSDNISINPGFESLGLLSADDDK